MKALIIFAIVIMAFIIIIWLIFEWGKRISEQAHTYDRIYASIQLSIKCDHVSNASYKEIKKRLQWLSELPYKDEERTEVLRNEFYRKYAEYNQADEFGLYQPLESRDMKKDYLNKSREQLIEEFVEWLMGEKDKSAIEQVREAFQPIQQGLNMVRDHSKDIYGPGNDNYGRDKHEFSEFVKGCHNCNHRYVNHKTCDSSEPCKGGNKWEVIQKNDTSIPCDLSYTPKQPVKTAEEILEKNANLFEEHPINEMYIGTKNAILKCMKDYASFKDITDEIRKELDKAYLKGFETGKFTSQRELPSDEEIEERIDELPYNGEDLESKQVAYFAGAQWMRNKITNK